VPARVARGTGVSDCRRHVPSSSPGFGAARIAAVFENFAGRPSGIPPEDGRTCGPRIAGRRHRMEAVNEYSSVSSDEPPGPLPSAGGRADAGLQGIPLPRFAWLLTLGILGLAGLLSLGVGGIVLVQGHVSGASGAGIRELRAPSGRGETSSLRADPSRGSGAATRAAAGTAPSGIIENGARRERLTARTGPAPRESGSPESNRR